MNILDSVNWGSFGIVILILAVLSVVFTVLILLVNKFCAIKEDPKIEKVKEKLTGANCGGCGYAGCADFAKALVEGRATISNCASTPKENKEEIAKILGVAVGDEKRKIAVVKCAGDSTSANRKFEYTGNKSCAVKNLSFGGDKICSFGCLSGGDCEKACKFNAMAVKEDLASSNISLCTGCGACVKTCPKGIIELIPFDAKVYVACSSKCKGKEVMDACKNGCIGCGLCAKNCPNGAIEIVDNLPVINYDKCVGCGLCSEKCPRKTIKKL